MDCIFLTGFFSPILSLLLPSCTLDLILCFSGTHFKAVVFFSTCASVEFHHSLFTFSYWPYDRNSGGADRDQSALLDTQLLKLHGNLTQQERTKTYQQFCKNAEGILLCTDVGQFARSTDPDTHACARATWHTRAHGTPFSPSHATAARERGRECEHVEAHFSRKKEKNVTDGRLFCLSFFFFV